MATLMIGISIPDATEEDDPDEWADRIVSMLNDDRQGRERIMVSLFPTCQWFKPQTLDDMRTIRKALVGFIPDESEHIGGPDVAPDQGGDRG